MQLLLTPSRPANNSRSFGLNRSTLLDKGATVTIGQTGL